MARPTTSGGKRPTASAGKVTGSASATWTGTDEQKKFRKAVLKAAIQSRLDRGRTQFKSLKASQLKSVPGASGVQVAVDAAEPAGKYLEAAKKALELARAAAEGRKAAAKAKGTGTPASTTPAAKGTATPASTTKQDEDILNTVDLSVTGYRSVEQEEKLWKGYFPGYYNRTVETRSKLKDPHGAAAVTSMVRFISGKKAPPGFSKHTMGISIDFYQTRKIGRREVKVSNSTVRGSKPGQLKWGYDTWIYSWLHDNAAKFGFKELATEAWHYDHVGVTKAPAKKTAK